MQMWVDPEVVSTNPDSLFEQASVGLSCFARGRISYPNCDDAYSSGTNAFNSVLTGGDLSSFLDDDFRVRLNTRMYAQITDIDYDSNGYARLYSGRWNGSVQVTYDYTEFSVAEPSVLALMGLGIFGLGLSRRKLKK